MKTIASLNGPEFLRACNRVRHAVAAFLAETDVLALRKILPEIPEGATEEEEKQLLQKQGRENFSAMLDRLLDEKPEATYRLLCAMIIPEHKTRVEIEEDPETHEKKRKVVELPDLVEPDGMDLIAAGLELVCTPKVMDFFIRLAKLVDQTMAD